MSLFVPWVGIEPTLPKKLDFESSASTNSATKAYFNFARIILSFSLPVPDFQYFSLSLASDLELQISEKINSKGRYPLVVFSLPELC